MNMQSHYCTILFVIWAENTSLQVRECDSCQVLLLLIKFIRFYDLIANSYKPYIGDVLLL